MEVELPADLDAFVREQIAAGRSKSAAEVVARGLTLLKEQEKRRGEQMNAFHTALDRRMSEQPYHDLNGEELFSKLQGGTVRYHPGRQPASFCFTATAASEITMLCQKLAAESLKAAQRARSEFLTACRALHATEVCFGIELLGGRNLCLFPVMSYDIVFDPTKRPVRVLGIAQQSDQGPAFITRA